MDLAAAVRLPTSTVAAPSTSTVTVTWCSFPGTASWSSATVWVEDVEVRATDPVTARVLPPAGDPEPSASSPPVARPPSAPPTSNSPAGRS